MGWVCRGYVNETPRLSGGSRFSTFRFQEEEYEIDMRLHQKETKGTLSGLVATTVHDLTHIGVSIAWATKELPSTVRAEGRDRVANLSKWETMARTKPHVLDTLPAG